MAPIFEVPQEIIDIIIGLCADDSYTLKSCSLVAKSWIIPSRRLLFRSLVLGGTRRLFRFRHQEPIAQRSESPLEQLLELDELLKSAPELATECIQSLRLRFESFINSPAFFDAPTNSVLCRILERLERLKSFNLHLGRWGEYAHKDSSSQVEASILALIRKSETESILISNTELASARDLLDFITYSPSLKQLSILDPIFRDEDLISTYPSPPTAELTYLRLDTNLHPLVPMFLDPSFNLKVNKLRQARIRLSARPEACELIKQLLGEASQTLQHLEFGDHPLFQDTPQFFPINNLSSLRSLHFTGFRSHGFHSSIKWIPHVFSDMHSPIPLEEVSISILTHRLMIPPRLEGGALPSFLLSGEKTVGDLMLWEPLQEVDTHLSSKNFPCLRRVDITMTIRDALNATLPEFAEKTRQSFTVLSAISKGMVQVNVATAAY